MSKGSSVMSQRARVMGAITMRFWSSWPPIVILEKIRSSAMVDIGGLAFVFVLYDQMMCNVVKNLWEKI